jgi:hypothetical protein
MMRRHPSQFRAVVESLESRLLLSSSMLHTVGNHLVNADGDEVRLTGVNIPSLDWSSTGEHLSSSVPEALNNWNANVIRLPVSEDTWLGSGGAAYKAIVDGIVAQANAANAYIVLDMHEYTQPDANSEAFWTDAATRYKNNPTVLFGLLNEPHGTTWDVWKNGDASHPGMQDLVDTVRATGADNIVVAGGLDYAYADDGVIDATTGTASAYALSDPSGNGIMYDAHIYPWKSYWVQHVGAVANLFPVIVGEVGHPGQTTYPGIPGSFEADSTWVPKILEWIDTLNLNWTGWAFYPSANPPGLPSMLSDWNYTPTSYWGAPAKAKLLSYDDTVSQRVLGGTVITDSADMAGRFVFSRGATYAFGDVSKFYQSSLASGGWTGLDLGRPATITQINYMPRYDSHGTSAAMLGGVFEASNTPDFSSGVVTLATITSAPVSVGNVYTTATVTAPGSYRYVRYVGPDNRYSQVDELRFFGTYAPQQQGLPSGWTAEQIGSYPTQGTASYSNGTWTLDGGGFDIGGTTDGFYYAHESTTGDQSLIARVLQPATADAGGTLEYKAHTGIMFRDSTATGSKTVYLNYSNSKGIQLCYRSATNGATTQAGSNISASFPMWFKLTKIGSTFTASYATTAGTPGSGNWQTIGSVNVTFDNSSFLAGLLVNSQHSAGAATTQFSNVSISAEQTTLPAGWSVGQIGSYPTQGAATYSNGTWTLDGGGFDISGTTDGFYYARETVSGDQGIVARVLQPATADAGGTLEYKAHTGIMFRDSTSVGSKTVYLNYSNGKGLQFCYRSATNGTTTQVGGNIAASFPMWLKLTKVGTTYTAYYATTSGTPGSGDWQTIGSATASFDNSSYLAGLLVNSQHSAGAATTQFSNVDISASLAGMTLQFNGGTLPASIATPGFWNVFATDNQRKDTWTLLDDEALADSVLT